MCDSTKALWSAHLLFEVQRTNHNHVAFRNENPQQVLPTRSRPNTELQDSSPALDDSDNSFKNSLSGMKGKFSDWHHASASKPDAHVTGGGVSNVEDQGWDETNWVRVALKLFLVFLEICDANFL